MYIINLTYKQPLERVDFYLDSHVAYLEKQYDAGLFLLSGRKNPRIGGLILAAISDKRKLLAVINEDPFKINDVAEYELIEFIPSKSSEALRFLCS